LFFHSSISFFPLFLPGQVRGAGVRLGVSTHNWEELGRALSLRPSYISLGPIFHTNSKVKGQQ
jgi:thiamine monophosphate synthase